MYSSKVLAQGWILIPTERSQFSSGLVCAQGLGSLSSSEMLPELLFEAP